MKKMSEKTFIYDTNGGNGGGQRDGFDPNFLIGAMMGGGGFGGGFGGGNWLLPFLLFALWGNNGFGGNGMGGRGCGNGFGFISDQLNNEAGRELIVQGLQCNRSAIDQLASTLGCSVSELRTALNGINGQICALGNQIGMSTMQIVQAINNGDFALQKQLCDCCCEIKGAIAESNYLTERAFCNTNQILARGFSDLGYASAQQTCELKGAIKDSTDRIIEGQRAAEMRELQRDLNQRDRELAQRDVVINNYQQTQTFGAMLQPIGKAIQDLQSDVDGIKCKLPKTEVINASPDYVPINRGINVNYAQQFGCGCGYGPLGYGFWNGNGGSFF